MRRLWIFILFLAISCQLSAVSGQQNFSETENLRTSKSESILTKDKRLRSKGNVQKFSDSQVFSFSDSKKSSQVFSFSDSQILYFESQIRLADSLYKNYLPQYNFEEVKAAVMFFDSLRLTTDNSQRTTDLLETENLEISETEKSCEPRAMSNEQRFQNTQSSQHEAQSLKKTVDCCPLSVDIEYQRARAHYYHAVGLTERDDIVGACEHYFIALEIMESETENLKTSKSEKGSEPRAMSHEQKFRNAHSSKLEAQSPDYEKIRFIALIYTRLGRLLLNENYCDLAMLKYKKALNCLNIIKDSIPISYTYKTIGNVYQLLDKADSSLYHYRRSLEIYSGLTNKLDIEKSIAQILFEKGERDSAYTLIKNNLDKLDNYSQRDSYYATFGEMYYMDKVYDSAIFYLEKSVESQNYYTKQLSSQKLSAIYDSIGDYEKKVYYDNIISDLSVKGIKRSVKNNQLQDVYDKYKERKVEKERAINKKRTKLIVITFTVILILSFAATLFIRYIYKRKQEDYINSIKEKDENLLEKDIIIKQIESEIERLSEDNLNKGEVIDAYIENIEKTTTEINELKKNVNEKEIRISELLTNIKARDEQIGNYKEQTVNAIKADLNSYYETEICEKILLEVKYKNRNKTKKITLNKLKPKEIISLKYAANSTLNHLLNKITSDYRKIDNEDLICICLLLLDASTTDISELMGKSYNAVWTRITKIKNTFKLDADSNLQSFLLGLL